MRSVWFLAIGLFLVILTAGCIRSSSLSTPTITPTPEIVYVTVLVTQIPTPAVAPTKYNVGDLFYDSPNTFDNKLKADLCYVIYEVDLINRNYTIEVVYRNQGETQWRRTYPRHITQTMEFVDDEFPTQVGHVDISTIKTEYTSQEAFDAAMAISSTLTPTKTPIPIKQSMQFGGAGDMVRDFTLVGGGGYLVFATVSGPKDNFIVHINDDRGKIVEYLFNEISPYTGKTIVNLKPGKYYLSVKSGGPWEIDITST